MLVFPVQPDGKRRSSLGNLGNLAEILHSPIGPRDDGFAKLANHNHRRPGIELNRSAASRTVRLKHTHR
jgi:hypothetical protein